MLNFKLLNRGLFVIALLVVITIVTLAYYSNSRLVAEQAKAQQQSFSPVLALTAEHFMKPLFISETLGQSSEIRAIMTPPINPDKIYQLLRHYEQQFGMEFFIASEPERFQYFSTGRQHSLIEGEVDWYFRFKNRPVDTIADVGRWDDTQFYIDLKVYSDTGEFLGFFGTAKRLSSFVELFNQYKVQYGYDFIFLDSTNRIMLSSDQQLRPTDSSFHYLDDLGWYKAWQQSPLNTSLNNELLNINQQEHLVTEIQLPAFGWRMMIINPLQKRKAASNQEFLISVALALGALVVAFGIFYQGLRYYAKRVNERISRDSLTGLPNRDSLYTAFEALDDAKNLAVILVDLDHFKRINDSFGHNMGDEVLKVVSKKLSAKVSKPNLFARWGGEEFLVLLPNTGISDAHELATSMQASLISESLKVQGKAFTITASFGVAATVNCQSLEWVVNVADKALYEAKNSGRNKVVVNSETYLASVKGS